MEFLEKSRPLPDTLAVVQNCTGKERFSLMGRTGTCTMNKLSKILTKMSITLLKTTLFMQLKCLNVSTFHWSYNYHKMITIMILPMCARRQHSGKFQAKLGQIVTKTLITSFSVEGNCIRPSHNVQNLIGSQNHF